MTAAAAPPTPARFAPTPAQFAAAIARAHPLAWFRPGRVVRARVRGHYAGADPAAAPRAAYQYRLTARPGAGFDAGFAPELTPAEMLRRGVFEGCYLNDCTGEFPREWFTAALAAGRLRPGAPAAAANEFQIRSRLPWAAWQAASWLHDPDDRGWFQWYCRYWLGRRLPALDALQIRRWRAFRRHVAQVEQSAARLAAAGRPLTLATVGSHRPRQRQALLQWAYRPRRPLPG